MWFERQANGFRGWFGVKLSDGSLRTGLVGGDFTVTIRNSVDDDGYTAIVQESGKPGLYRFDITDTFLLANGVGEYGVVIEIDTFAGPSSSPNIRDSLSTVLRISQKDFDSLTVGVDTAAIADAVWDEQTSDHQATGSFGRALGFQMSKEGTVTGGTDTILQTTFTEADGYWDDHQVVIQDSNTGLVYVRNVQSYLQTNGAITLNAALPFAPDIGYPVVIFTRSASTSATATVDGYAIADAVWSTTISSHNYPGTFGSTNQGNVSATIDAYQIANAVWEETMSSHQTSNTFGYLGINAENVLRLLEFQRGTHTGANGVYYWDPFGGDDANNGLTPTTAKLTWGGVTGVNSLISAFTHDVVIIIPGDPTGQTIITEQIDIDKEYTFLRGPGRDILFRPTATTGTTITVSATGVELSGMRVETAVTGDGDAINVSGNFCKISNVHIDYSRTSGIRIQNASLATIERVHITSTAQDGTGDAILFNGATSTCQFNFVSDARIIENANNGVRFTGANCSNNFIFGGLNGTTILRNDGYGALEHNSANQNHLLGPVIHVDENVAGNVLLQGPDSDSQNITQWSTHIPGDIWDVPIIAHTVPGTFGRALGFQVSIEAKVTGGTASAITTSLVQPDGYWNDHQVVIQDTSTNLVVVRNVQAYLQAAGEITFNTALPFTPSVNDPVLIFASSAAASATIDAYAIAPVVASAVWEEPIINHTDPTTFGGTNQGTTSVDAYQIADAVWTTQASGYFNNVGSMGQVLGFTLATNAVVTNTIDGYTIETNLTQANNYWSNHQVIVYDVSTGVRVVRSIGTYLQSNGTITFNQALPFTAVPGDLVMIITRSSSATATAVVDVTAIASAAADAVWDEPLADHTDTTTFGSLQFGAEDGYAAVPDTPTNTNVAIDRGNYANAMITGVGQGSIRFISKSIKFKAQTNRLTISVRKRSIGISVDGGQNFLTLAIGVHSLSIGWIDRLLINGDGTWEVIASFN